MLGYKRYFTAEEQLEPSNAWSDVPLTKGEEEILLRTRGAAVFPRPPFLIFTVNGEYIMWEDTDFVLFEGEKGEFWKDAHYWKKVDLWLLETQKRVDGLEHKMFPPPRVTKLEMMPGQVRE